jgi:hypothetical protein
MHYDFIAILTPTSYVTDNSQSKNRDRAVRPSCMFFGRFTQARNQRLFQASSHRAKLK